LDEETGNREYNPYERYERDVLEDTHRQVDREKDERSHDGLEGMPPDRKPALLNSLPDSERVTVHSRPPFS